MVEARSGFFRAGLESVFKVLEAGRDAARLSAMAGGRLLIRSLVPVVR
jgi:hypothetical protein